MRGRTWEGNEIWRNFELRIGGGRFGFGTISVSRIWGRIVVIVCFHCRTARDIWFRNAFAQTYTTKQTTASRPVFETLCKGFVLLPGDHIPQLTSHRLEVCNENIREKGVTTRIGEDRIGIIFLLDQLIIFNVVIVQERFRSEMRNIVMIRDDGMPMLWACQAPCLKNLWWKVAKNDDSRLIRTPQERADEIFEIDCLLFIPVRGN